MINFRRLFGRFGSNIGHMEQFYEDARDGKLPQYTFIEPRLIFNHNDEHPPSTLFGKEQDSSVLAGEQLIADIYNAIRTSARTSGSNWSNTAFLLVYDEHGGCYDHVPPQAAPPPIASAPAGKMGFRFDRLGVRVPAILVSAHTAAGTVINTPLQHTSVIKTLSEKWGLGHLTDRDKAAPDLSPLFNASSPRPPEDWPTVSPRPFTPPPDYESEQLNDLQRGLIGMAQATVETASDADADVRTVGEGLAYLKKRFPNPL